MSRLIEISPDSKLEPQPEGFEFGYYTFEDLEPIRVEPVVTTPTTAANPADAVPTDLNIGMEMTMKDVHRLQMVDPYCSSIIDKLLTGKLPIGAPFYLEDKVLHGYVVDNKQPFKALVVPPSLSKHLLEMAHDCLGHNGSASTYTLLRRPYYWQSMKNVICKYIQQCHQCRRYNVTPVKYATSQYSVPKAPFGFHCHGPNWPNLSCICKRQFVCPDSHLYVDRLHLVCTN